MLTECPLGGSSGYGHGEGRHRVGRRRDELDGWARRRDGVGGCGDAGRGAACGGRGLRLHRRAVCGRPRQLLDPGAARSDRVLGHHRHRAEPGQLRGHGPAECDPGQRLRAQFRRCGRRVAELHHDGASRLHARGRGGGRRLLCRHRPHHPRRSRRQRQPARIQRRVRRAQRHRRGHHSDREQQPVGAERSDGRRVIWRPPARPAAARPRTASAARSRTSPGRSRRR